MFFKLRGLKLRGKRVLLRTDYNVPVSKNGRIKNSDRINSSIPTINYILRQQPKQLIIMSHLGRPKNKEKYLSMNKVAKKLQKLLGKNIKKIDGWENLPPDKIVLLENLRFNKGEEKGDLKFAKQLAKLGDVYVNEAFSNCHRDHASMTKITRYLKSAAGFGLEKEINVFSKLLKKPSRPLVIIMGGAKLKTKIPVIENMAKKADYVLLGGAMYLTFYKALGYEIGKYKTLSNKIGRSVYEPSMVAKARSLKKKYDNILVPIDIVVAGKIDNFAKKKVVKFDAIPKGGIVLDIGKDTINMYKKIISSAKTVFWNGPLGYYELLNFQKGTRMVAKAVSKVKGVKIAGGGDTISMISKMRLSNKFDHVSTGGGASLEFMAGKELPAIKALKQSYKKHKA